MSAAPPQPKKRPVDHPRKASTNDEPERHNHHTERPRKRSTDDSKQENSSGQADEAKQVRQQYSYKQKERVVKYARHHGVSAASRKFNIAQENVQRWFKDLRTRTYCFNQLKEEEYALEADTKPVEKLTYPREVGKKLLEWLLCMREWHLCVLTQMLCDKARAAIAQHSPSFRASEGWLRKFMRHHSIVLRAKTSVAQKLSKDLESKIEAFYKDVQDLREDGKYSKEMIGNMDKTPLYFNMIPSRSLEKKGAKEVRVKSTGAQKRHITMVFACTGAGKMLPPMTIFKGNTICIASLSHLCLSHRLDNASHKRIDSPTWIYCCTPKQSLDGWSIDAEMGEGDLAQVH